MLQFMRLQSRTWLSNWRTKGSNTTISEWKSLSRVWLCNPMECTLHGILQARILDWVAFPFSRGTSQPKDHTQGPQMQVDYLPAEPPGKPKNTGVGSLSLLQQIFPTQKSNWGLLQFRRNFFTNWATREAPTKVREEANLPYRITLIYAENSALKMIELNAQLLECGLPLATCLQRIGKNGRKMELNSGDTWQIPG